MRPRSRIQTTGQNNGHQLWDNSKSSNRSENRPLIYAFKITNFAPANRQLWYKLCNNMRI